MSGGANRARKSKNAARACQANRAEPVLIIAIMILAMIVLGLLSRPRRQDKRKLADRRGGSEIYDLPDDQWHDRRYVPIVVPVSVGIDSPASADDSSDNFTAGGGDFGGGGSSGDWSDGGGDDGGGGD